MSTSEILTSLVRQPTRLSLGLIERGLNGALAVTHIAQEMFEPRPADEQEAGAIFTDVGPVEDPFETAAEEPFEAPAEEEILDPAEPAAPSAPLAAEPAPSTASEFESLAVEQPEAEHVDEEPVVVAEVAEQGAEDGAGPELHVEEPWPDYDSMSAADVRRRLDADGHALAAAVALYEGAGRNRRTVIEAAERRLR